MKDKEFNVTPEMQIILDQMMEDGLLPKVLPDGKLFYQNQMYQPYDMQAERIMMPVVARISNQIEESEIEKIITITPLTNGKVRLNLRGSWFEKDVENGHRDCDRTFDYPPTESNWDLIKQQIKAWLKSHLEK